MRGCEAVCGTRIAAVPAPARTPARHPWTQGTRAVPAARSARPFVPFPGGTTPHRSLHAAPCLLFPPRILASPPLPTPLLPGFLGAGKSSLVNCILRQKEGRRVAVIENELGEVGIDSHLGACLNKRVGFATLGGCQGGHGHAGGAGGAGGGGVAEAGPSPSPLQPRAGCFFAYRGRRFAGRGCVGFCRRARCRASRPPSAARAAMAALGSARWRRERGAKARTRENARGRSQQTIFRQLAPTPFSSARAQAQKNTNPLLPPSSQSPPTSSPKKTSSTWSAAACAARCGRTWSML